MQIIRHATGFFTENGENVTDAVKQIIEQTLELANENINHDGCPMCASGNYASYVELTTEQVVLQIPIKHKPKVNRSSPLDVRTEGGDALTSRK